jgi:hypothetical protein
MKKAPDFKFPALLPFCVMNTGQQQSVTIYDAGANGNTAPRAVISQEQGSDGFFIASDAAGKIYVANGLGGPTGWGSVAIYATGATANVPLVATITSFHGPTDSPGPIAVDLQGSVYTASDALVDPKILVFAAGAQGNAAPVRTITGSNTLLFETNGIAVDRAGLIYIVNYGAAPNVVVYAANADGNAQPIAVIAGPDTGLGGPEGVAVDAAGNIYVRNMDYSSVTVYAKGSNGNVAPMATIEGSETGIFGDGTITVDALGTIYITNQIGDSNSVTAYAPGTNGNEAPALTLTGPATGLNQAEGIALLPASLSNAGCLSLLLPGLWRHHR